MNNQLHLIITELEAYYPLIDDGELQNMANAIAKAERVFLAAAGRSACAARGFSNRLMQLGKTTYVVGDTTTPALRSGDLLLIGSGSGATASLITMAEKGKTVGATIATLTMFPEESIGRLADIIVTIPGSTPKRSATDQDTAHSRQPMGTLFEQLSWLTYDALVLMLMPRLGQTDKTMFVRHANLE